MPRYVIHVGPMKTGSTYLQKCLTAAAGELEAQGVCYPLELLDPANQHMHLPVFRAVRRSAQAEMAPVFKRLNSAGHKVIVLSCEHFSKFGRDAFSRLKTMVGVEDIEVIYAVRHWSERIPSMWFQSLFVGHSHSLPEFYVKLLNGMAKNADIDYTIGWRRLSDSFGRQNVSLFPYSAIMDRKEDIFTHFCTDVLKLAHVPTPETFGKKAWASFSLEDSEILRVLNAMYFAAHGKTDATMYWHLNRGRTKIDLTRTREAIRRNLRVMTIDEKARHFDRTFRRMEAYADRVVGGGIVFGRTAADETYAGAEYLLEDGVGAELRAAFAVFNAAAAEAKLEAEIDADEEDEAYEEDNM